MLTNVVSFFHEKFSFLSDDPIIYFLLAIFTILGAFWGRKGISKKKLAFRSISFPIIRKSTNTISNVNLLYKEEPIPNLTITNFIIWNSSDKCIRKDDIVPKSLLRFTVNNDNSKILDISIINTNNPSNNTKIVPTENGFIFTFDFLNKKNGVVVQVIHTGQDDDINFTGELIDGNLKCENLSSIPFLKPFFHITFSPKINKIMDTISLICISIIFLFIAIISGIMIAYTAFSIATISCLLFLLIIFFFYFSLYKTYFTVPRCFSSFLTLDK